MAFAVAIYRGRDKTSRCSEHKKYGMDGPNPWLRDTRITYARAVLQTQGIAFGAKIVYQSTRTASGCHRIVGARIKHPTQDRRRSPALE